MFLTRFQLNLSPHNSSCKTCRSEQRALVLEQLEPRTLLATTPLALGFDGAENTELTIDGAIDAPGEFDRFTFELGAGDVLGAAVRGKGQIDPTVSLTNSGGELLWFNDNHSSLGSSWFMAHESPLPRLNSNSTDSMLQYVIDQPGTYSIQVAAANGSTGSYEIDLVLARPGMEAELAGTTQMLYVDFDGATVQGSRFLGGSGLKKLSPLRDFLPRWGLTAADESALINVVMATIHDNLSGDVRNRGFNGDFAASGTPGEFNIQILNSRDNPEFDSAFGDHPYLSRVVVGGTTEEMGLFTVAQAQGVDVGNFLFDDDAVVMLDWLSAPSGAHPASLNQYAIHPSSSKVELVGTALGVLASHEAGHNFGNWHTDPFSSAPNIMDNRPVRHLIPDGVFGFPADPDLDFGLDALASDDATLDGQVNTLNVIAFGLSTGTAEALRAEHSPVVSLEQSLTAKMAEPLLNQAISHWQRAGASVQALGKIDLHVADLPDTQIGRAYASSIILDSNAAGWGWEIDADASRGSMDLLSALTHEVGHLLDYEHGHEGYDVMAAVLPPGPRVLRILEPEPLVSQPIPQLSRAFVSAALVSEAPFAIRFSLRTGSVDANQVMIGGLQRDSSISVLDMMPIDSSKDWRALCADRAIAMLYREQQSDNSDDDLREDDLLDLVIADVFNG